MKNSNSKKATPNLPMSSRMQIPSTSGGKMNGIVKETGGMKGKVGSVTKKVMAAAKGKGMKGC